MKTHIALCADNTSLKDYIEGTNIESRITVNIGEVRKVKSAKELCWLSCHKGQLPLQHGCDMLVTIV